MVSLNTDAQGFPKINGISITRYAPQAKDKLKARFARTNTNAIMATEFEPIRWIVRDYVPEGFTVLAGRQKLGKTWLALDYAIAVATGSIAMGSVSVDAGNVLYVDLENGHRRIQRRIRALYPDDNHRPDLSGLEWVNDAPALDKGFIDQLEDWRLSVEKPRLVVIDVLQKIKPAGIPSRNAYENDYVAWSPLQRWAMDHGIAVIGLHHTRKGGADDPLEALSGSNGLSACADTTLVLDRDQNGCTLYGRGRDIEEIETAVQFEKATCRWRALGKASDVRRTDERSVILELLADNREPMSPSEIADALGLPRNNVKQLLFKMAKAGEVEKSGKRGHYAHPDHAGYAGHPTTPNNLDNRNNRRFGEDE